MKASKNIYLYAGSQPGNWVNIFGNCKLFVWVAYFSRKIIIFIQITSIIHILLFRKRQKILKQCHGNCIMGTFSYLLEIDIFINF